MIKKRIRRLFPMDFYGDHNGWRFIIRANNSKEVLTALMWRSYISEHRKLFNLFEIAIQTFPYVIDDLPLSNNETDYSSRIKMLGPIVEVATLDKRYAYLK